MFRPPFTGSAGKIPVTCEFLEQFARSKTTVQYGGISIVLLTRPRRKAHPTRSHFHMAFAEQLELPITRSQLLTCLSCIPDDLFSPCSAQQELS